MNRPNDRDRELSNSKANKTRQEDKSGGAMTITTFETDDKAIIMQNDFKIL